MSSVTKNNSPRVGSNMAPIPTKEQGKASFVIDKVEAMMRQEQTVYLYRRYVKPQPRSAEYLDEDPEDLLIWREKICHWTYSVIDHFELSRKTVAVSINLFDRYLATQGNRCDGSLALLVSLTTLYIAIKVHERKKIKLETLAELSRCQFESKDIEEMEIRILESLSWFVHPPIVVDFISHLLKFLPAVVPMPARKKIFELSRYMAELSLCDPLFMEHHPSTIAFAAIINVLEHELSIGSVSVKCRSIFYLCIFEELGFCRDRSVVNLVCDRLDIMVSASAVTRIQNKENDVTLLSNSNTISDDSSILSNMSENTEMVSVKSTGRLSRCSSVDSKHSRASSAGRMFRQHRRGSVVLPCN